MLQPLLPWALHPTGSSACRLCAARCPVPAAALEGALEALIPLPLSFPFPDLSFKRGWRTDCLPEHCLAPGGRLWLCPNLCPSKGTQAIPCDGTHVLCASIICVLTQLALCLTLSASAIAFNKLKAEVSPQREQSPPGCRTRCHL